MKPDNTNEHHVVAYHEICALVDRHAANLSLLEMIAVASNIVGKLMAMQDQRTVTPEMMIELVRINMKIGSVEAVIAGAFPGTAGSA